jgi:nitrate/nitrite transport system substrate-binding protein
VGEPWNQLAVRAGLGRVLTTSRDVWNNGAEKVLGVTADWAEAHPRTLQALVRALIAACAWLENRVEAAQLVAQERYVAAPLEAVAYPLLGYVQHAHNAAPWHVPDAYAFHRFAAHYPWAGHALWYGAQMHRAGQLDAPPDLAAVRAIHRADLYREAAAGLGLACSDTDLKPEGVHDRPWELATRSGPLLLGPDLFIDGAKFLPE